MNRMWLSKISVSVLLATGSWCCSLISANGQSSIADSSTQKIYSALRLPERALWTIDFIYDSSERESLLAGPPSKPENNPTEDPLKEELLPRKITISKDGTAYREITLWTSGKTTEKWIAGEYQILELPNTGELVRVGLAGKSIYKSDYSRSDFGELDWILQGHFKGLRKVGEQEFMEVSLLPTRISSPAEDGLTESDEQTSRPLTALFSKETHLPYLVDDGEVMKIYSFPPGSSEALSVPPRFKQEFQAWMAQINKRKVKVLPSSGSK